MKNISSEIGSVNESKDIQILREPDGNWIHFHVNHAGKQYECGAKIFSEPSDFGISNGRISKLAIQRNGNLVFNYDRGHDLDKCPKAVVTKILKAFA